MVTQYLQTTVKMREAETARKKCAPISTITHQINTGSCDTPLDYRLHTLGTGYYFQNTKTDYLYALPSLASIMMFYLLCLL
jgi:hypothetical protein